MVQGAGPTPSYLQGSDCLGADTLLQLLKNYARNNKIKTTITVGADPPIRASTLGDSVRPALASREARIAHFRQISCSS